MTAFGAATPKCDARRGVQCSTRQHDSALGADRGRRRRADVCDSSASALAPVIAPLYHRSHESHLSALKWIGNRQVLCEGTITVLIRVVVVGNWGGHGHGVAESCGELWRVLTRWKRLVRDYVGLAPCIMPCMRRWRPGRSHIFSAS